jgi:hypothetical protein
MDKIGNFRGGSCNNVEKLVDVGMVVLVISAPSEQRSGSSQVLVAVLATAVVARKSLCARIEHRARWFRVVGPNARGKRRAMGRALLSGHQLSGAVNVDAGHGLCDTRSSVGNCDVVSKASALGCDHITHRARRLARRESSDCGKQPEEQGCRFGNLPPLRSRRFFVEFSWYGSLGTRIVSKKIGGGKG